MSSIPCVSTPPNEMLSCSLQYIGTLDVPRPTSKIEIVAAMRRIRVSSSVAVVWLTSDLLPFVESHAGFIAICWVIYWLYCHLLSHKLALLPSILLSQVLALPSVESHAGFIAICWVTCRLYCHLLSRKSTRFTYFVQLYRLHRCAIDPQLATETRWYKVLSYVYHISEGSVLSQSPGLSLIPLPSMLAICKDSL